MINKMMKNQYKVGTKVIDTIDVGRKEVLGATVGDRVVVARLYYPAVVKNEEKVVIKNKTVGEMYENPEIGRAHV